MFNARVNMFGEIPCCQAKRVLENDSTGAQVYLVGGQNVYLEHQLEPRKPEWQILGSWIRCNLIYSITLTRKVE